MIRGDTGPSVGGTRDSVYLEVSERDNTPAGDAGQLRHTCRYLNLFPNSHLLRSWINKQPRELNAGEEGVKGGRRWGWGTSPSHA